MHAQRLVIALPTWQRDYQLGRMLSILARDVLHNESKSVVAEETGARDSGT